MSNSKRSDLDSLEVVAGNGLINRRALLITGYLGGAIATHVRVGDPLLTHTLFPIYVAAMVWGGLYLRDDRVRALIAPRRPGAVQSGRPGGAYGQVSV